MDFVIDSDNGAVMRTVIGIDIAAAEYKLSVDHVIASPARTCRFTPESGYVRCTSLCLLCANSGHRGRLRLFGEQRGRARQNYPDFGEVALSRIDLD